LTDIVFVFHSFMKECLEYVVVKSTLFHYLLSRCYLCHCDWSGTTGR